MRDEYSVLLVFSHTLAIHKTHRERERERENKRGRDQEKRREERLLIEMINGQILTNA